MVTSRRAGALAVALILFSSCGSPSPTLPTPSPSTRPLFVPVIAAAGDISCAPGMRASCKQMETADVVGQIGANVVLALGDNQYDSGELADFLAAYEPSWGRFRSGTRPVPGNHEYQMPFARGYYDYFNGPGRPTGPAGDRTRGYYSFDVGAWHVIALNSNCREVGGCQAGSPQEVWLRLDLQSSDSRCTLAFFHHPLFASGVNGNTPQVRPLWQALYDFDADVILNGHEHVYERFAPQTPQGVADPRRGVRQFVVGTGGHSLTHFVDVQPNSEVRSNRAFGVLKMELGGDQYSWEFRPIAGAHFEDSGTGACH